MRAYGPLCMFLLAISKRFELESCAWFQIAKHSCPPRHKLVDLHECTAYTKGAHTRCDTKIQYAHTSLRTSTQAYTLIPTSAPTLTWIHKSAGSHKFTLICSRKHTLTQIHARILPETNAHINSHTYADRNARSNMNSRGVALKNTDVGMSGDLNRWLSSGSGVF